MIYLIDYDFVWGTAEYRHRNKNPLCKATFRLHIIYKLYIAVISNIK